MDAGPTSAQEETDFGGHVGVFAAAGVLLIEHAFDLIEHLGPQGVPIGFG